MIPELGQLSLIIALLFSIILSTLPLYGVLKQDEFSMRLARPYAYALCTFIFFSYACLTFSFVMNDFTVAYVAQNSNTNLPIWYRMCAVWGAHEGSILLWVLILSFWTAAVARFSRHLPIEFMARVLSVLGMIAMGFLIFTLATSNPFLRILTDIPQNGRDLNVLLQDPGFLFHPPMLYMGYVGFSVAFAFAIASLMAGRLDTAWAKWTRPWTLVSWCCLTIGITLGSWWAYRELGWGGWWFWDPVENASLLPWLVGTALVHSLMVTEQRDEFRAWTILLAISAFSLSLLGTFLVRSGVLTSVHAFAVDPTRGLAMLIFLFIVIGASLLLYAFRGPSVRGQGQFKLISRESMLMGNNLFLMVAMATVLLGTLYPLILDALHLGKISVGAPYFNAVMIPIMVPMVFIMGLAPHVKWQSMSATVIIKRLLLPLIVSIVLAVVLPLCIAGHVSFEVVLGLSLAIWLTLSTIQHFLFHRTQNRFSQLSMTLAHLGIAVCITGITLSSAYSVERDVKMSIGDSVSLASYNLRFDKISESQGPNYQAIVGEFQLSKNQKIITELKPEKKYYPAQDTAMTEAAIDAGLFRDVYIALGEPLDGGKAWAVRLYYKPFIRWIWAGGFFMLLGGLFGFTRKRYFSGS